MRATETASLDDNNTSAGRRWLLFGSWILVSSLIFSHPIIAFVRISLSNPDASHLILVPFISAWVIFVERRKVFRDLSYGTAIGGFFFFLACGVAFVSRFLAGSPSLDVQLSGYILALVLSWIAGFALLFGESACRAGYFSLLLLFLMVPLPNFLLIRVIYLLQLGSAWIAGSLFDLVGVPVLREGFVFHLARFNIEVAKECSGIRSSMALLVLALLTFSAQPFLEQSSVRCFRTANDDPQERNPNLYTFNTGNLCRSGLSPRQITSRRRYRLFCAGITIAPARSRPASAMGIQESSGDCAFKYLLKIPDLY